MFLFLLSPCYKSGGYFHPLAYNVQVLLSVAATELQKFK